MFIIFRLKSIIKQLLDLVYGFLHLYEMYTVHLYELKCIDSVFVICQIIIVSVRVISLASVRVISLAFGSADNSYLDTDNSAYHKNLIQ